MGHNKARVPTKEELEQLYWRENISFAMIAERFGYSKTGIRDMFKRFGISSRTLSEAQQIGGQAGRCRYSGGFTSLNGYKLIKDKSHHRANGRGYVMEHIVVLERKLGRHLLSSEVGHHLNGIKHDNRPGNLIAMVRKRHSSTLIMQALHERIRDLEGRLSIYEPHAN